MVRKFYLYTFGTEGSPYDKGKNLTEPLSDLAKISKEEGDVDKAYIFTPRKLKELGYGWAVKEFNNNYGSYQNRNNPNYHLFGLGAWRSVLLSMALNNPELNDGDVIIVHDSDSGHYPGILKNVAPNMRLYAEIASKISKKTGGLFAPMHNFWMKTHTRACVRNYLLKDDELKDRIGDFPTGRCRCIVATVSQRTKDFAKIFLETCQEHPELLSAQCLANPEFCSGFKHNNKMHNCFEQSVFNCLAYRDGFFPDGSWVFDVPQMCHNKDSGLENMLKYYAEKHL